MRRLFSANFLKWFISMRQPHKRRSAMKIISSEKGQALVEFTLALPLLLFILAGIAEFGILFYNKQVLTNASREGARAGIVRTDANGDPYTANIDQIVQAYCQDRLITFGGSSDPTISHSPEDLSTLSYPSELTVTASFQYNFLIPSVLNLFGGEFGPTLNISGVTVMRSE